MESAQSTGQSEEAAETRVPRPVEAWIRDGYFVCITLKEARNLRAFDLDTQSSDTFAKMKITMPGEKAPVIVEHRTRIVHRSLYPMFEERLLCPLAGLKRTCQFELRMYDADWLRNAFMGQVQATLGQLLQPLEESSDANLQWFSLTGKRHKLTALGKIQGEVMLEVQVLTPDQAEEVAAARDSYKSQELIGASLTLSGIVKPQTIGQLAKGLKVEIRVGQSMAMHKLHVRAVTSPGGGGQSELEVDDTVAVPLATAFDPLPQLAWPHNIGKPTQVQDIKVLLHSEKVLLSKTQVPLWSIPVGNIASSNGGADSPPLPSLHTTSSRRQGPSRSESGFIGPKGTDAGSIVAKEDGAAESSPQTFVRTMEPIARKAPFAASAIEFSMCIGPKKIDASPSRTASELKDVCQQLDMLEEQEDERDAPPLTNLPEPFGCICLEMNFDFGPCRLYRLLLKSGNKITAKIAAEEGLTNLNRGPWEMVDTEEGQFRQRKMTYRKPVSVPVPFAPKYADMTEIMTIKVKEIPGWVVEIVVLTNAPMGDTFKVVLQVTGTRGPSAGSSVLRVSMKMEFLKNPPGMLKQVIQNQTQKESIAHWSLVGRMIREAFDEEDTWQSENSEAQASPLAQAPSSLVTAVPAAPDLVVHKEQNRHGWQASLAIVALVLLGVLLALLVVSIQQHASAVRMLAASIQQLAAMQQQQQQQQQRQQQPQQQSWWQWQ
ncbi:hypothetical protein DUNSADRAFT_6728 [Dunaliella salina]|uniref:C2 domain-containing protein n=1 Tax=Dunaliella salina TaxID=3046 RepID=A0ABQ7H6J6_DUNSA|nr:hypothetical protein DUNSADRAFT_6728 [Dunaliella salina]|eukprot:KAF5842484.1 hypothetical protein DUNSADRAFT_6728 [Dunaliella salina]